MSSLEQSKQYCFDSLVNTNSQKQSRGFYHAEPKLKLSESTSPLKTNMFFGVFFFQNQKFQSQLKALPKTKQAKKTPKQIKILASYLEYITNIALTLPEHSLQIFLSKIISGIQCDFILSELIFFPSNLLFRFKKKEKNSLGSSQHSTPSRSLQG